MFFKLLKFIGTSVFILFMLGAIVDALKTPEEQFKSRMEKENIVAMEKILKDNPTLLIDDTEALILINEVKVKVEIKRIVEQKKIEIERIAKEKEKEKKLNLAKNHGFKTYEAYIAEEKRRSKPILVSDFKVDYSLYLGNKVRIKGLLTAEGDDKNILYAGYNTRQGIFLDFSQLDRVSHKEVLKYCYDSCSGAVVEGIAISDDLIKVLKITR